jgi:hypothetical protein
MNRPGPEYDKIADRYDQIYDDRRDGVYMNGKPGYFSFPERSNTKDKHGDRRNIPQGGKVQFQAVFINPEPVNKWQGKGLIKLIQEKEQFANDKHNEPEEQGCEKELEAFFHGLTRIESAKIKNFFNISRF